jgi:hypothetical protein
MLICSHSCFWSFIFYLMLPSFLLSVQHVRATQVCEGLDLGGQSGVSISLGLQVAIVGHCPLQLPRVSPRAMRHLPPPWRWHRCPRRSTGGEHDLPEGGSHRLVAVRLCPSGTPGGGHSCPCVSSQGDHLLCPRLFLLLHPRRPSSQPRAA